MDLTFQRQPMGKNAVYYYDQLIELYNLVCVRLNTERNTRGPSLVRQILYEIVENFFLFLTVYDTSLSYTDIYWTTPVEIRITDRLYVILTYIR
jgi:hypothetical protein